MWAAVPGSAAEPTRVISGAASGGAPARRVSVSGDLVSIYNFGPLQSTVAAGALAAAGDAGAFGAVGRGFGIGLVRVTRSTGIVKQAPGPLGSWSFPTSVTALPLESISAVMGAEVSKVISLGQVVMGRTSADLSGAQAGDVLDLVAANGVIAQFVIGRVAPDAEVGGTEIVMSTAQADSLGATRPTSVLIYGQFNRSVLDAALAARGLSTDARIRVRRSWDVRDPDSPIGLARTKTLLGQFAVNVAADGTVTVDDAWRNAFLPAAAEIYPTGIRAVCNKVIRADLAAALQEVVERGLAGLIEVANTNAFGGCFGARFSRIVGAQLQNLSRHTWGQALDTNTVSNCQGCVPRMDCRIVRIFRAHNFAWGGNFLNPDGMHFEWVGEPRNTYQYPSRYCPNTPSGAMESLVDRPDYHGAMFAEDGWSFDDD